MAEPISPASSSFETAYGADLKIESAEYLAISDIKKAALPGWPDTSPAIQARLEKLKWPRRDGKGRGRKKFEYLPDRGFLQENQKAALDAFIASRTLSSLPAAAANFPCSVPPPGTEPARLEAGRDSHAAVAGINTIVLPGDPEYDELVSKPLWREHDAATQDVKDRARADAAAPLRWKELRDEGFPKGYCVATAADENGIGGSTLRGWLKDDLAGIDPKDWVAALLDQRGRCGPRLPFYDEGVFTFYKSDYLRKEQPTRQASYRDAVEAVKLRGVPEDQIPAEITLWRRLTREVSWQAIKFAREGEQALHRTYPKQRRDHSTLHAMEVVNGDGYRWNNLVLWPDGEIARPLMWHWQDVYSGMILAWRLDKTENAGLLRLAIGDLISNFCIPNIFLIDNTLAAASKWITGQSPSRHRFTKKPDDVFGVITQLGARHIAALPVVGGSSKPCERAGGDYDRDISRGVALKGSYLGNAVGKRPEGKVTPVPLAIFEEAVRTGIARHNSRPGRRSAVCRGRSLEEAFRESFATVVARKPTAEQLRLCMLAAEKVTCRKLDGVIEIFGNRYWSENTARLAGQEVVVRFDPDKLHEGVFVYTSAGRLVGEAKCHAPVGFIDTAAAQQHNRLRRQNLKHHKAVARNAQTMTAIEMAAMLPKPPQPERAEPSNVRHLYRHALEQPKADAPARREESAEDIRAARRAHRLELEKLGTASWTKEQKGWVAVFDSGIAGDDPLDQRLTLLRRADNDA
jgi:putative transposase